MKRWLLRLLAAMLLAIGIVAVFAWLTLRASLPQLEGQLAVAGLAAPARIDRDAGGIPTITAASRPDLAFATGFAHGQDRFFQMDTIRRRAAGELSALAGPATLAEDRRYRLHRFRSRAAAVLAALPGPDRLLLDRYAAGVNAGLQSLGAKPFEYYVLDAEPQPWRSEDSVLALYTMFAQLNDSRALRDLQRGFASRALPAAVFNWMYPQGTSWDAPLMGSERATAAVPPAAVYSIRDVTDRAPPANEQGKVPLPGSNNWAVGGALTATGRALVANDMHLGHAVPNIYYQAQLRLDGPEPVAVTGVMLPGSPFVVAGSNGHVAWGFTNSWGDWSDAVVLRPGSTPGSYLTPAGDREFTEFVERIEIRDAEPLELRVRETVWGPVLDSPLHPDGDVAISWIAHKVEAVNLRLVGLETVKSVAAALDVANTMGIPPQNFVAGDADGNIGWTIAGIIPLRGDYDPTLPADWSAAEGWTGWLAPADYPRIVNPDSHRIWTANARVADGPALAIIGDGGYDLGARARQIRDALFAADRFAPEDMLAIQYDDRALFLARWRTLLLDTLDEEAVAGDAALQLYRQLVDDWIPRAAPDSVGYRLVRAFRLEVQARVFHGLTGPVRDAWGDDVPLRLSNQFEAPLWSVVTGQPPHLLPGRYPSWRALLLGAVQENIRFFDAGYADGLERRSWGERNTALIRHPLSAAIPLFANQLDMPRDRLNGDTHMPKAQGPNFGASERFAVAPGDEANGLMHMPAGQSGHPLSDFYRRGHADWVNGRPSPFLPGGALYRLELLPGGD